MIIAIDPGISNCGVSISEWKEEKLLVHETVNVAGNKVLRELPKTLAELYGDRVGKIQRIIDNINKTLDKYPNIKDLVIEAPFIHVLRKNAFVALMEVITAIKFKVAIERGLTFTQIEPTVVKKSFATTGAAGKDTMYDALCEKVKDRSVMLLNPNPTMTEHEVDAVGIGYSYYKPVYSEASLKKQKKKLKRKGKRK